MKSVSIPKGKWDIERIDELEKTFSGFGKDKSDEAENFDGWTLALARYQAEFNNQKLTLKDIGRLIAAFNRLPDDESRHVKGYLILMALLTSRHISTVQLLNGSRWVDYQIYKRPKFSSSPFYDLFGDYSYKLKGIGKIQIYGSFRNARLGINEVVGKVESGLCHCCRHEVDKTAVRKILDLKEIGKIRRKENTLFIKKV